MHPFLFKGHWYVVWIFMVTLCFVYNCWVIPLRSTFPYQTPENANMWFALDYSADFIYLVDVALVKPRISHLEDGFWVTKPSTTRRNYFRTLQFKVQTFWECYNRLDSMMPSAYVVRMARTLTYMLYLIHLNACAYYAFSAWQGLGANGWVFSGKGSPLVLTFTYIRCFYFATKTATSIGKNPKPETEQESLFMTCSWLMGVFVFAILIGQMRDIVVTATHSQTEYRKLVDETLEYMRRLNLPKELQERIKLWFTFTWEQQHTLGM
uniref:Ion transport domain-containing protein n=1 Tax=Timema shepardi TaxID=629360 RepID=A0A7R9B2N3_TIMSH|nr:unnamed protein product [Timema shepardi]